MVISFRVPRSRQKSAKNKQHEGKSSFRVLEDHSCVENKKCSRFKDDQEQQANAEQDEQLSCRDALCSCFGGLTGICAAFCCCPFTIVPLAGFVCVKIPAKLASMVTRGRRRKAMLRKRRNLWSSSSASENNGSSGDRERPWPVNLMMFDDSGRIVDEQQHRFVETSGFGNSGDWRDFFGGSASSSWRSIETGNLGVPSAPAAAT